MLTLGRSRKSSRNAFWEMLNCARLCQNMHQTHLLRSQSSQILRDKRPTRHRGTSEVMWFTSKGTCPFRVHPLTEHSLSRISDASCRCSISGSVKGTDTGPNSTQFDWDQHTAETSKNWREVLLMDKSLKALCRRTTGLCSPQKRAGQSPEMFYFMNLDHFIHSTLL